MSSWKGKRLLVLAGALALVLAVGGLAVKRVRDAAGDKATLAAATRPPAPVRAVRVQTGPVQSFIFGQGTARSVRRNFLTFEGSGKVTFLKTNEDGQPIRAGDRVAGPGPGERLGELLASLDSRVQVEQLTVAQAGINESRRQAQAAQARVHQAEAQLQLAEKTYARNSALHKANAVSRQELDTSQANLKAAAGAVASAKADLDAAHAGVDAALARVEQHHLLLERNSIYAPFDGILTQVNISEGDFFAPNLVDVSSEEAAIRSIPLLVIDPEVMEVTMDLPAFEGLQIRPDQKAVIMLDPLRVPDAETERRLAAIGAPVRDDSAPQEAESREDPQVGPQEEAPHDPAVRLLESGIIPATVFSVSPSISPSGRSIQVKVRTSHAGGLIRDGMFVACWIVAREKAEALQAPFDVFIYRQNRPFVLEVDEKTGTVAQRAVVEGIAGLTVQEIASGVAPGVLLVTDGRHGLSDGAPVDVVEIVSFPDEIPRETKP